ncbi:MAG: geranylgeranyl reductase family protein [Gallionella sp.]|nr:MAG: geranylgeranyl reductase family protein [Gallionella sp.]
MVRIKQSTDCDVLIAGAGPAGAVAAFYLAGSGYKVCVLDKDRFPRDKVCGDFVGPVGLVELLRLGVTRQPAYQQSNKIFSASCYLDGGQLVSAPIPPIDGLPPFGRVIPRMQLDQWILEAAQGAGATILEGYRVKDVMLHDDAVMVVAEYGKQTSRLRARLLIGADGSNSIVARALRGHAPADHDRIVAIRAYYENVAGPHDQADLYFSGDSFPGYCWLFPTGGGGANVGVGVASQTMPKTKFALKSLLQQLIEQDHALGRRLRHARIVTKVGGWPLTTYNHRLPIVWDRVMLAGDAAGLINPLNGEGIQYALLSGRWAAHYAVQGLCHDTLAQSHLMPYARTVESELRYDMSISNMIVQLIRNRSLNPLWLRALQVIGTAAREQPGYAAVAGGVLAGLIPANNLLGQKIIWGSIKQAAISLGGEALIRSIYDPAGSMRDGFDVSKAGVKMAFDTMRNPLDSLKWGMGVTGSAAELTKQVYRDAAGRVTAKRSV